MIAEKWSEEDQHTNYRYNVEHCANGKRVYLLRPTWLNKGFDFQVNVEGLVKVVKIARGATREMPSHGDVIHDLRSKLGKRPKDGEVLFDAVCAVYDCGEPAEHHHAHAAPAPRSWRAGPWINCSTSSSG